MVQVVKVPGLRAVLRGGDEDPKLTVPGEELGRRPGAGADVGALGVGARVVTVTVVGVTLVDVWGWSGER